MTKRTLLVLALFTTLGCGGENVDRNLVRMATTTSTDNSGLMGYLLPRFTQKTGIRVDVIAVGTGKAIKHGENGDVDLILVHARDAEDEFVRSGHGVDRRDVMHNDFVIVGPPSDPAGIEGIRDVAKALGKVAEAKSTFISRGDDSGTHKMELSLWKKINIVPKGDWYKSAGQGMGKVLVMANDMEGYTLTDRGTFIAYQDKLDTAIMCEGDPRLNNPYGVILVNPKSHPHVRSEQALAFIDWITSKSGQDLINSFKKNGQQLFFGDAE